MCFDCNLCLKLIKTKTVFLLIVSKIIVFMKLIIWCLNISNSGMSFSKHSLLGLTKKIFTELLYTVQNILYLKKKKTGICGRPLVVRITYRVMSFISTTIYGTVL